MKRRFKKRQIKQHDDLSLQITSLADILIIVLIFLLKSYASGMNAIDEVRTDKGISLPKVLSGIKDKNGIKIEIAKDVVRVDGKSVASLRNFRFKNLDLRRDLANTNRSAALTRALRAERGSKRSVWIIADESSPYETIQTVITSAAVQGLTNFKLAVVKQD